MLLSDHIVSFTAIPLSRSAVQIELGSLLLIQLNV